MKSPHQIPFRRQIAFAFIFSLLVALSLGGCARTENKEVEKERRDMALREATEAYAKAAFARGEKPQPAVSVRQLEAWGFLKEADIRGLENKDLFVAVNVEPVEEFRLAAKDIEQVFVGEGSQKIPVPQDGGRDVFLKMTPACSALLRETTARIIGRKLRVSAGSVTVVEARVVSEVPGPWVKLSTVSNTEAKDLAGRLNKFLQQTK